MLQFVFAVALIMTRGSMIVYSIVPAIMFLFIAVFFGWFYALGTNLHKLLPESMPMNLNKFKIFLLIPILYIALLCVFIFFIFKNIDTAKEPPNLGLVALIIPAHLFSMFCIFYCLYFNAKTLKAVELQRPVTFNDFAGEFFLLWFYPIGIWIIQPRINKIFEKKID